MTDLLSCPFCGSRDLKSGGDDKIVGTWCLDCGAAGPNEYGSRATWNRRSTVIPAEIAEVAERLRAVDHMSVEDCFLQSPLFDKAAALIERLAASQAETAPPGDHESELTTLRSEYLAASKDAMDAHGEINRLRARVEELERERNYWKIEVEGERAKVTHRDVQLSCLHALLDKAREIIEAARDDFEIDAGRIIDDSNPHWTVVARAFLAALRALQDSKP